jgi:group I intron endonuclease
MIGIYKITSPSGRVYIGQSTDIDFRFNAYKKLKCKSQVRIYMSLVKHGVESHTFEVIEECSVDLLNERERYWQDFYDVLGKNGLNCNLVSTSNSPKVLSDEMKSRISASLTGFKHSEESRVKISKGLIGRPVSDETRRKLSESNKNKHSSPETARKISEALKGRKIPKDVIEKRRKSQSGSNSAHARIVLNTENGVFYGCIKEAAECYGINKSTLNNFLIGHRKNKTCLVYA